MLLNRLAETVEDFIGIADEELGQFHLLITFISSSFGYEVCRIQILGKFDGTLGI